MDPTITGIIGFVVLLVLFLAGMPIAFAMALVGFLGMWYSLGLSAALGTMAIIPYKEGSFYLFIAIPLFILMGYFAAAGGLINSLFAAANQWVGRLPGGLAMATVATCAAFGAASGSSIATTATMGRVALPEMERYGYSSKLGAGCVVAGGGLASLIPPSGLMVLFAVVTEQSVGKMLIAGFIPGAVSALFLMATVFFLSVRNPSIAPRIYGATWKSRVVSLKRVWGILLLAAIIMGGIYSGVVTPTEAGALAAGTAFLMVLGMRKLTWANTRDSLLATGRTTSMILILIIGGVIFAQFLAVTQIPLKMGEFIASLPVHRMVILAGLIVMYIFLGTFLDAVSQMVLTMPIVFPIILALGFDPVWFGVMFIVLLEIGFMTPPLGINVYVLAGVAPHIPMGDIFRGIFPFVLAQLAVLAVLVAFPQIVLVLPNMMK